MLKKSSFIFYRNSCFSSAACRGIHQDLDAGTCHLLYDTTDVPENERPNYNTTLIAADGMKTILVKGFSLFSFTFQLQDQNNYNTLLNA